jgi:putative two-component system response regulator
MTKLSDCTVLVVDDTETNVEILVEALDDSYDVSVALDGETALEIIEEFPPDLILLDIMMPGIDGFEVCRILKSKEETKEIPIIFLTAMNDVDSKTRGFGLGAVDFVTKPFEILEIKARVKTHLSLKIAKESLKNQNVILEEKVIERTQELEDTKEIIIHCLASLAETRDPETGGHIRRTQHYVKVLANEIKDTDRFKDTLDDETVDILYKTAPLHDIGKVGVPDNILLKPGKLTDEEFDEMKRHTVYGRDAIISSGADLGTNSFLRCACEIAYTHQEKWDGSGYPEGLSGDDIPISGRLMAVADVYDALISARVYKPPMDHIEACNIIREGKGTHFDPDLIDAFEIVMDQFQEISLTFKD